MSSSSAERTLPRGGLAELRRPGDATRLRIRGMPAACLPALEVAAVIGREFDLDVVAATLGASTARLEADLRQALDEGILQILLPGRLRFAHAAMRESLYRSLGAGRAVQLHRRVGEALESSSGESCARAAELAHHFRQVALAGGDPAKALRYSALAAETASAMLAYEEAVVQIERALEVVEQASPDRTEVLDGRVGRLTKALEVARRMARP